MLKKSLLTLSLAFGITVWVPSICFASGLDNKFSSETWLKKFQTGGPSLLCRDFITDPTLAPIMQSSNMTSEKCVPLLSKYIAKCITRLSPQIPQNMDINDAQKWGSEISKCAASDLYDNDLKTK